MWCSVPTELPHLAQSVLLSSRKGTVEGRCLMPCRSSFHCRTPGHCKQMSDTDSFFRLCHNSYTGVAPITNLLKAKAKIIWSPSCEQAFQNVMASLCNYRTMPVLMVLVQYWCSMVTFLSKDRCASFQEI